MENPELLSKVLGVTPFGCYCKICNRKLGASKTVVWQHYKENHDLDALRPRRHLQGWISAKTDQAKQENYDKFLLGEITPSRARKMFFCFGCHTSFPRKKWADAHVEKHGLCNGAGPVSVDCYPTVCGRFAPLQRMDTSNPVPTNISGQDLPPPPSKRQKQEKEGAAILSGAPPTVPEGFFVSKDELVDKISPYCREGEAPRDWASILQFLFVDPAYHGRILSALDFMEDSDDDPALVSLLAASKMWLEGGYCDLAIQRLPGNIRATLASFESNENTSATTHLFKPRKGYGSLQQELKPLLRYLMRAHTTIIDDLKALLPDDPETILRKNIIPAILSRVAVEEVPDQNSITHVAWFSLFRSFHRQGKGGAIKLVECGWYGSKLACILHLLRCGVACFMAYSPSPDLMCMAKSMQGA